MALAAIARPPLLAGAFSSSGSCWASTEGALTGSSPVLDTGDLGLDRFDEHGTSRLASDPMALPFPERVASSPGKEGSR